MKLTAADQVWFGCASLQQEEGADASFTPAEIAARAAEIAPGAVLRHTLQHHATDHCVGNRWPSGGGHRMLFQTRNGGRRLIRSADAVHPRRLGKVWPEFVPAGLETLLEWWQRESQALPGDDYLVPREHASEQVQTIAPTEAIQAVDEAIAPPESGRDFERFAKPKLERHFGVTLTPQRLPGIPKTFDFVSPDGTIVGDAKFFTLVRGMAVPPAKNSVIAEYSWLLQKTKAARKFLVFGNDRRVPERWLEKHRSLVPDLEFLFLDRAGKLEKLHPKE